MLKRAIIYAEQLIKNISESNSETEQSITKDLHNIKKETEQIDKALKATLVKVRLITQTAIKVKPCMIK